MNKNSNLRALWVIGQLGFEQQDEGASPLIRNHRYPAAPRENSQGSEPQRA